MTAIEHPCLGKIVGKIGDGVVQYLNIKYGFLRHRFGEPSLHDKAGPSDTIDATRIGPSTISAPDACNRELELIQQTLPLAEVQSMSDTECLNLNITVPDFHSGKLIPVLVFVHGGALATGSGTWPQYDFSALVKRSANLGMPFVGVTINYRTSIFGFLTSQEFRAAGFTTNNGLRDQKMAFQWIKKNIFGFGGDPSQVTALGQSAGGVSLTLQLQSREPLFQRLVVMSGTCLVLRPVPKSVHEMFYQSFCEAQGLTNVSGQERIRMIEEIDSQKLLLNMHPGTPFLPVVDDDVINDIPTFNSVEAWSSGGGSTIPGLQWCKELLVGDSQMDGSIYQLALAHRQQDIATAFEKSLKRNIFGRDQTIDLLLSEYKISSSVSVAAAYYSILELANDLCFYLPEEMFAQNFPGTTYVYHLNVPNPWEGPFKGQTTHIFDVALFFRNFDDKLPTTSKEIGLAFGDSIVKFVSGQTPWQATSNGNQVAMVFGLNAGIGELRKNVPEAVGRRNIIFKYNETIGLDLLLEGFVAFLGGR